MLIGLYAQSMVNFNLPCTWPTDIKLLFIQHYNQNCFMIYIPMIKS